MKKIRVYNTKLTEIKGWPTSDKRGAVDIIDEKNGFAFSISFGKSPKIEVFKNSSEEDFGQLVFEKKL